MDAKKLQGTSCSISFTNTYQQGDFPNINLEQAFHPLSYLVNTPTYISTHQVPTHYKPIFSSSIPHRYTIPEINTIINKSFECVLTR
jgi:hypothetical protein